MTIEDQIAELQSAVKALQQQIYILGNQDHTLANHTHNYSLPANSKEQVMIVKTTGGVN